MQTQVEKPIISSSLIKRPIRAPIFTIENALKLLIAMSASLLGFAYLIAWAQRSIGDFWGFQSGLQLHVATSGLGVLLSLFSDTSVLFYFIGTAVWMRDRAKDVAQNVSLERGKKMWLLYESAGKLKAKTFPFATFGLALAVFSFILGGATQVGAISGWVHPLIATLFLINSLIGMRFYYQAIDKNLIFLDQTSAYLDGKAPDATN